MKFIKICILVLVFVASTSCDCLQHVTGVVVDFETQLPIDNVKIIRDTSRVVYSDSLGYFVFTSMTGGVFGCPKILLSFEKEGYIKENKKYKSCCTDNSVVVLKKQAQ